MHFISQTRYNPSIGADDYYYRIKESVRDLTGRVHSYVLLNVGFMTPRLKPGQVRDIAVCLNWLSGHRDEQDLFGDAMSRYDETVRSHACEYWQRMVDLGTVDRAQKITRTVYSPSELSICVAVHKAHDAVVILGVLVADTSALHHSELVKAELHCLHSLPIDGSRED
jgi:hypothetical protein